MIDATIRALALDGTWEVVGADRAHGVWPIGLQCSADRYGPSQCSFTLRRDGRRPWPDLTSFTPIEVEVGGATVWSGRITETPQGGRDLTMSVSARGWQYHLDDDPFFRNYVRASLGGWVDTRSLLDVDLAMWPAIAQVSAGDGMTFGWPAEQTWYPDRHVGVTYDAGPWPISWPKRFVVNATCTNFPATTMKFRVWASTELSGTLMASGDRAIAFDDWIVNGTNYAWGSFAPWTGGSTTARYVHMTMYNPGTGAPYTPAANTDLTMRINQALLFAETSYESGNASILKASQVIADAVTRACPLLSTDLSRIVATSFSIPEMATDGLRTAREYIDASNVFHNYVTKVDAQRRICFYPQPSRPVIEVGEYGSTDTSDASANSGDDIYNQVLVQATDPGGRPVHVLRTSDDLGYRTLPDRRGFKRTKILEVSMTLPADGTAAAALGDAWLGFHVGTPFRGSATVRAGAVREVGTGREVGVAELLGMTGELVRFSDRQDPDTGGWGRDGRIVEVSWDAASGSAALSIDNTRASFEALLARLGVANVQGGPV